jgi:predicted nucleic acid-binding protein
LAVDAFTVAVADLAGGAVIATADSEDLKRLAFYASLVVVADVR